MTKNEWPPNLPKQDKIYFKNLAEKAFPDKNKVVWVRLEDFNYPRMALNHHDTGKNQCVKPMTAHLEATTKLTRRTSKYLPPTTGRR
jgi:hypothetical protein